MPVSGIAVLQTIVTAFVTIDGSVATTHPALTGGSVTASIVDAAAGHGWPRRSSRRAGHTPAQAFDGAQKWGCFSGRGDGDMTMRTP